MSSINGRGLRQVVARTEDYEIVPGRDNGLVFTNKGATGAVTFQLPPATPGQWYRFYVAEAQELRIDPHGTETIAINGSQQSAGLYITADAPGEQLEAECVIKGRWETRAALGTWTAESA